MEVPPLARRVIPIVTRAGGRVSIRVSGSLRYLVQVLDVHTQDSAMSLASSVPSRFLRWKSFFRTKSLGRAREAHFGHFPPIISNSHKGLE